jgi:crossover junction endodeoxyribonuclease RuvC
VRLAALDVAIRDLVARYQPDEVAVEGLFHARNPRSAIVMGHARGVILLAAGAGGAAIAEYAPLEIKMSITGFGSASKQQVREMVIRLIAGAPPRLSLDAADALAVALCHANRRGSFAAAGLGSR